ncbi:MAG: 3-oxoacyl-[acyl-carrier-protein] reductase [Nitrospiraceae bacterium]|nr:MAG: 3-oxoacyl-[acyl-carrier-protein] reductase [Nitrospiraceae bacterium]
MEFDDRIVVVTGGAQGIGRSISEAFVRGGASVVVADISLDAARETAAELEIFGRTRAVQMDVSQSGSVVEAFKRIKTECGGVDILVNNAGITRDGLILRMNEEDWDAVLDINLKGVFLCTKEAVKIMVKQRRGKIINIASVVAFMGNPGQANYGASKAGIIGFTKTIAREYASRGITVNSVAPGFIQTAMTDALDEQVKQEMLKSIPAGTFGSVDDVAQAVVFLASAGSNYITGQVIHVNGGMYM